MNRTRVLLTAPEPRIRAKGCERFSNPDIVGRVPFAAARDRPADHTRYLLVVYRVERVRMIAFVQHRSSVQRDRSLICTEA
jgi:hypothetical protein